MSSCSACKNLFSIAKDMKVSSLIANMMAFSPPTRINYDVEDIFSSQSSQRGACYQQIKFIHKDFSQIQYPWIEVECYRLQKCSSKKRIVLLRVKNIHANRDKKLLTILFSHGNACDLSSIYPFLIDLSTQLKADVVAYDYSGYGRSEGSPSEEEIYSDVEQVMDFLTVSLLIKQESIVLLGNSLGSVPTVHISVKNGYTNVKGMILLSPIASGMKLVNPNLSIATIDLEKIDVFCNLSKVTDVKCPVFLIHGTQDEVIPQSQSQEMLEKIKHVYEWFPRRGTHSNILIRYRSKFFTKVKLFLEHLNYTHNNHSLTDLLDLEDRYPEAVRLPLSKPITKQFTCEENYIKCDRKFDGRISSPVKRN